MADGPDTLIWRIAADAMNLAVSTTRGLCRAVEVHPNAERIARKRIGTLRSMAAMLTHCADEFDSILAGDDEASIEEIVSRFAHEFDADEDDDSTDSTEAT